MKIPSLTIPMFAAGLLLCSAVHAKPLDAVETATRSEEILAPLAARYPALSVTVYRRGQIAWTRYWGHADAAGTMPVGPDTRFNIYSTAKAVTGLAYARLAQAGALDLDAPVTRIEPGLPVGYEAVTTRQLLSHTAGVRHYRSSTDWLAFSNRRCDTPKAALDYFVDDPLDFPPGERRQYSSFGFVLLSRLLVRITGEPDFAAALDRTLGPWARFTLDREGAAKAQPYILASQSPDPVPGVDPEALVPLKGLSAECKFGAGGLLASSAELAQVGAALSDGRIVPVETIASLLGADHAGDDVAFGVAAGTTVTPAGTFTAISQGGAAPGGRSYLYVLVEPQVSVAIAGNFDGPDLGRAAKALARLWASGS